MLVPCKTCSAPVQEGTAALCCAHLDRLALNVFAWTCCALQVDGEGVVGHYPLLRPGEAPFVYQSCTQQNAPVGFMGGSFTFAEGCIARPTGPQFEVASPEFELRLREYVF